MTERKHERVRVLIADARPDVREALTALLDATDEFEVVGQASSPVEAATCCPLLAPDIVLLDPHGRYDEEALGRVALRTGRLIILTLQDGMTCRAKARDLGALVIDKGISPEELLSTLRRAARSKGPHGAAAIS